MKNGIYLTDVRLSKEVNRKNVYRDVKDIVMSFESNHVRHKDLVLSRVVKKISSKAEKNGLQLVAITHLRYIGTFS